MREALAETWGALKWNPCCWGLPRQCRSPPRSGDLLYMERGFRNVERPTQLKVRLLTGLTGQNPAASARISGMEHGLCLAYAGECPGEGHGPDPFHGLPGRRTSAVARLPRRPRTDNNFQHRRISPLPGDDQKGPAGNCNLVRRPARPGKLPARRATHRPRQTD